MRATPACGALLPSHPMLPGVRPQYLLNRGADQLHARGEAERMGGHEEGGLLQPGGIAGLSRERCAGLCRFHLTLELDWFLAARRAWSVSHRHLTYRLMLGRGHRLLQQRLQQLDRALDVLKLLRAAYLALDGE